YDQAVRLLRLSSDRARASAGRRPDSQEVPPRPAPGAANREPFRLLSAPRAGKLAQVFTHGVDLLGVPPDPATGGEGAGRSELPGRCDDAGHARGTRVAGAVHATPAAETAVIKVQRKRAAVAQAAASAT